MNSRRIAELLRMRADLTIKVAQVDAELATAFVDDARDNEPEPQPKRRLPRPTLVRVPARTREPSDLAKAQAEAALRELGYK